MNRENWKTVKLGDLCEISAGGTPSRSKNEYWKNGTIPWVKIGDFSGKYLSTTSENITEEGLNNSSAKLFTKGTVLYSIFATLGEVSILDIDATTNQAIAGLKIKDSNSLNADYFYSYLKSLKDEVNQIGRGVAQNNINLGILRNFEIPLPPLDVQKQIALNLDQVTKVITEHKELLAKYDLLIKSRFIEMFGDIQNYPKEAFKECSLFIDYRGHTPEVTEIGEIRMINAKSVGKGFFKYINEFVTKEIYDVWMHRGFPKPNDVLFVTEGHTFGNTCQVPSDMTIFALGQRVITIRGNEDKLNNFYLNAYMQTDDFNQDINKYRTGGTAQGIRSKDLVKVEVPLPPLELQLQFADFVQQIDKSKLVVQQSLEKAETLYKSLMQEYFG